MYVKKEIREFIKNMPKKEKMTKEYRNFIQKSTIKYNLLIEHGKEEYECTYCGKYSYGKLLSDRNYKHYDICRFCGNKYAIKRSNLKNYFFLYNVAIVDNINNKLVIRYFQVYRYYNNRIRRFINSIAEFARYVPEYEITLLNNRCPKGIKIYHDETIKKWRVFNGKYYKHREYDAIYLKDIDEKKKGTVYQYIPLGDAINHLEDFKYKNFYNIFEKAKYESFELLLKAGLYNLALNNAECFFKKGSFENRFGVKKNFYNFMKKHDISYEELYVLKLIQRPNIEIIRTLLRISYCNLNDLEKTNNYINLAKLAEYSKKQKNFSIQIYLDYIDNLIKMEIPLTKKKLLPVNFSEAHDISIKKVKIVENKLLDEKIKQRYEILKMNNYKDNKFFIRAAKTLNDMKDEARQQNNCVYSNYSEKYANGITDIYFLRKLKNPNKSLVTVEVLDGKVRQKYEKRNTAINKEEKEFLNLWEKNILNVA